MIQLKDFSLLFLLLLSAATYSQNKIVGTITDSNGKPLPAVEFLIKPQIPKYSRIYKAPL
jgi:hypothetical protein